ncbi:MAG: methyltransferase domain-containing protein [bacterium]|nr:methyltransferase domain-containing protein [bacterium]
MSRNTEVAAQYQQIADWFDNARNKTLVEKKYLDHVLTFAKPEGKLLDLGCGSAEPMAAFFIGHGFQVTGIDIAPRMIELAQSRFPDHDWQVGDIRKTGLSGKYDVILSWDSFFHLTRDDQRAMFVSFAQHAAAGAVLLFNTGTEDGESYGNMEGHDIHHASLSVAEYKTLLENNGFSVIVLNQTDKDCGGRTVWLAQNNRKEL